MRVRGASGLSDSCKLTLILNSCRRRPCSASSCFLGGRAPWHQRLFRLRGLVLRRCNYGDNGLVRVRFGSRFGLDFRRRLLGCSVDLQQLRSALNEQGEARQGARDKSVLALVNLAVAEPATCTEQEVDLALFVAGTHSQADQAQEGLQGQGGRPLATDFGQARSSRLSLSDSTSSLFTRARSRTDCLHTQGYLVNRELLGLLNLNFNRLELSLNSHILLRAFAVPHWLVWCLTAG